MSRVCQTDGSFGPGVGTCRGGFDFTLSFEDGILGLLPQAALLLLAPIRVATLRRRRYRVVKRSHLGFLKTVAGFCYIISSVALLAIWSEIGSFKTKISIASAVLEFLGSLLIVTLSRLEHSRAVRPSHLLQFFLLVLLLCDAVRLRTLFLMEYSASIITPASIHTFLTGLLLLLESLDKRELFNSDGDRKLPPEETIGLFGKRLFWYLNGLFGEGYRKILKPTDLDRMDADLASKERAIHFQNVWASRNRTKSFPLLRTIIKVLWLDLLLPVFPQLIQIATTLSQPYLITEMIAFIQDHQNLDSLRRGYGLIAAFALNYTLLAISFSWSAQAMARFLTKLRGCLISTLYEKTLHATSKDLDLGSATVLMNVDVDKLLNGCKQMNEIWSAFIVTDVALYIMYTHLGVAFVAPFLTILLATALSTWLGAGMKVRQLLYAAATERRVTAISHVVGRIKGVRMLGLTETIFQMLHNLRRVEVEASIYLRKLMIWVTLISNVMFQLTTVSTYATFAIIMLTTGNTAALDLNKLYGSLSALKLFTTPLTRMLQLLPTMQISYASLERIETFLKGEVIDNNVPSESSASSDIEGIELRPLEHTREDNHVISLHKANFKLDGRHLLFDITAHFSQGTFTMVVGKVGSGKSVFLRSLVGETDLVSGRFKRSLSGSAFCDQQVWLRNATVRENIVGEDTFDETWYRRVLWSCGLLPDLQELKQGDYTAVGSKGVSLSGGQKNRLSLARALYARKPVLVIDDMLAGLDITTEKLVFDRVFGYSGILRKSGATVVLATHATHYARHADRIVVFSEGRIVEQGTYNELKGKHIDFRKLNDGDSPISMGKAKESDSISEEEPDIVVPGQLIDAEEEEDVSRQSGDRRSLKFFMKSVGWLHMTISCAFLVVGIAMTQVQYIWLKWWAEADDKSRSATIRQLYLFIIITAINILAYLAYFAHYGLWFQPKLSLNMHTAQLVALVHASFSFLLSTDIGSITNRFSQDIMLVDLQLPVAWLNVTFEVLLTLSSLAFMTIATPPIAGTIPILATVGYLIQRVYLRTSRQVRLMDLEAKAPLCTHFLETMAGIVTVRAFGWEAAYRRRNERLLEESQVPFYLLAAIQNWLTLVLELAVAGMITLIVGMAVGLRSRINAGYLGLALISAIDLGINFRTIVVFWTELETSLSAVSRILQFSSTPREEQPAQVSPPPPSWPRTGALSFYNFAASYTPDGTRVLTGITLSIRPGEKIGICGRTGSGKSSLVAALFGLLHRREGRIEIDGISTADVPLAVLRSKIVALPQEPFFLPGSVRYNLAPWTHGEGEARSAVGDARMEGALQEVGLWEKLRGLAGEGEARAVLDLELGGNVEGLLSQGERQLFCLARAMLMEGRIVVLDEATSSIDAPTSTQTHRLLRTAFADRIVLAVAHRLDAILDFDRVVLVDGGRVVEVGKPGELLEGGRWFKRLMEAEGRGK